MRSSSLLPLCAAGDEINDGANEWKEQHNDYPHDLRVRVEGLIAGEIDEGPDPEDGAGQAKDDDEEENDDRCAHTCKGLSQAKILKFRLMRHQVIFTKKP